MPTTEGALRRRRRQRNDARRRRFRLRRLFRDETGRLALVPTGKSISGSSAAAVDEPLALPGLGVVVEPQPDGSTRSDLDGLQADRVCWKSPCQDNSILS